MKTFVTCMILAGLIAAGSVYYEPALTPHATAAAPKDSAKIKALRQERLAILTELAAQAARAYQNGTTSFAEVHEANEAALRAELELADSRNMRIAICEKLVAEAKSHEQHVAQLVKVGTAPTFIPLKAKAHWLEAEIALEREKEKQSDK